MDKAKQKVQKFRQREQGILDAALELLMARGEDNVTVEQIAEHVDIGKGTIYKHFTSKTDIYMQLLYDYEKALSDKLKLAIIDAEKGDYAAPAKAYFESRISNPAKARLFQRLEERIAAFDPVPPKLEELNAVRDNISQSLNQLFQQRIDEGHLQNVPPYFYYSAYWALTQGAVELYHSKTFKHRVEDMEGLMTFIMELGIHMGTREASNTDNPATEFPAQEPTSRTE